MWLQTACANCRGCSYATPLLELPAVRCDQLLTVGRERERRRGFAGSSDGASFIARTESAWSSADIPPIKTFNSSDSSLDTAYSLRSKARGT